VRAATTAHLKEKLAKLAGELQRLKAIEKEMLASHDLQISLTDPDSARWRQADSTVLGQGCRTRVSTGDPNRPVCHSTANGRAAVFE
jgi:hypothetical protein